MVVFYTYFMKEKIDKLLDNINGFPLDDAQREVVVSDSKHLLVSAGAGSGKTLTIIGKIRYLIEIKNLCCDEIICISFTNEATNNLKNKLISNYGYDIPCYTFHKLGLEILKDEGKIISCSDMLEFVIDEYFCSLISLDDKKRVLSLLGIRFNGFNFEKKYSLIDKKRFWELSKLVSKFINLFKAKDCAPEEFLSFLISSRSKRDRDFLVLTYHIYYAYQKELDSKNEIDFSDMISKATLRVRSKGFNRDIKYIIIDEFQDTSWVRFNLVNEILDKTGASLLVVGDDFQSIYRFTGCDLDLFLKFGEIFPDGKVLKIENTYRNSMELIEVAGSFIMKNKNQLRKDLCSSKRLCFPLQIVYYRNIVSTFISLITYIHNSSFKPILILGRNNFDINMIIKSDRFYMDGNCVIYRDNLDIKMYYLTVHRSKGLEEENVIVINMIDGRTGFPNKICDDKVLRFVSCRGDDYLYSEERRLFYVAITRTKNFTYLLTPLEGESMFISELKRDYRGKIKVVRRDKF